MNAADLKVVSKASRTACHAARDAFYTCSRDQGADPAPSNANAVPPKCVALRKQFTTACPASWVHHFDEQNEASSRRAKLLASAINQADQAGQAGVAGVARGSLSGKR